MRQTTSNSFLSFYEYLGQPIRLERRRVSTFRLTFPAPLEMGVHISVAHGPMELEMVKNVLQAARALGVNRVSYVSGTSVREENSWFPMVGWKLQAEKLIQAAGIKYTVFKPTWFMEVIPNFVKNRIAVCLGNGEIRIHFLAVSDFAAMVAKAFIIDESQDQSFRILGPQPPSTENKYEQQAWIWKRGFNDANRNSKRGND